MNEQAYRAAAAAKGYGAPEQKTWAANVFRDPHAHDTDLFLYVQAGAITLHIAGDPEPRTCRAEDAIEVAAGLAHTEQVGEDGVTFLIASR